MVPGGVLSRPVRAPFEVHLDVYSGPFEVLLGLIAKHKLDLTEIALAKVTDDFVAYLRQAQQAEQPWDLSQASEFVLVAATLLDLKAARLLPGGREDDEEDLALIEARDLLFARLLQYRAYKQVAAAFEERMAGTGQVWARDVGVEDRFARLLPELVLTISPDQLAMIAASAMTPKVPPTVGVEHLHAPTVSVHEQAGILLRRLREQEVCSFRALVADAGSTLVIVARFLALLELHRESALGLDQGEPLGELSVRWLGTPGSGVLLRLGHEFDESDEQPHHQADERDEESEVQQR